MYEIFLLRHGEPAASREKRRTGGTDAAPADGHIEEAPVAGKRAEAAGSAFDIAFSPALKPAARTPCPFASASR